MSCIITKNYVIFRRFLGGGKTNFLSKISWCPESTGTTVKKKDVSSETLNSKYNPQDVESCWYEWWEKQNYFKPTKSETESFIVLLPPPNVTGTLHLGHVLTATIQDVILRWKRMKGESVIWIPGIDHAGIATQVAVEKYLAQTLNLSKKTLGREKFVEKIWEWKEEKEKKICQQLRNIGASLDWSRLKFTMDPVHSKIVTDSFIKLFDMGLIYRNLSLVNWSCALESSISDIEVEWLNIDKKTRINVPGYEKPIEFGIMYKIAYKVCDEDDEIVVDTTRPETMLGDVAIAVHPNDPLNAKYINKMVWHPFRCEKIPIIPSDSVDPNLGTGAVKITPSHSFDDFEVGSKHNLKHIDVINQEGCINNIGMNNKFFGLKRFDARKVLIDELENLGLFRGAYEHAMKLPICSRSGDVVELIKKKQWFLNCKSLAADAIKLVETNNLKIEPENYVNVWYKWLNDVRDWNLSRQLWWGHQIPVYKCTFKENKIWVAAENLEQAKLKASEKFKTSEDNVHIVQDPDVLDTWFSSGLLPLNVLSDINNESLKKTPISLMITGHDIMFFWVARMVMLSISLTGKLPFDHVLLHSLLCHSGGKKMSKSLGNVIQPEDIINGRSLSEMKADFKKKSEQNLSKDKNLKRILEAELKMFPQGIPACGTDALRFTLCSKNIHKHFNNFNIERCHSHRHFCNKIWQAMRYFIKITNDFKQVAEERNSRYDFENLKLEEENLNVFDKWILSRLATTVNTVDRDLNLIDFKNATTVIRLFAVDDFCSIYLESTKPILQDHSSQYLKTILVFYRCMETILMLLSPFMPFVTEHLYHALPRLKGLDKSESITIAEFPNPENWKRFCDVQLQEKFQEVINLINALRRATFSYQLIQKKPNGEELLRTRQFKQEGVYRTIHSKCFVED